MMIETAITSERASEPVGLKELPPSVDEKQLVSNRPAAAGALQNVSLQPLQPIVPYSAALRRYQHYAATLGRELALLLLCHGSSALAAAVRLSYKLGHMLILQLQRWLSHSKLPKTAAAVLARALSALRALLQQHVARPLGRLLTQLVWVQVQLSADDVMDEGTHVSARLNSCVSLLFGSIRLRSHSCLQLAAPSHQPVLSPEFSLTSPVPSPKRLQQQQQQRQLQRSCSSPQPSLHGASAHPTAATAAGQSSRRRTLASSRSLSSTALWGPEQQLNQSDPRASVVRALRFSQQAGQQGLAASSAADSEVHVLCSSELKTAILAFLQAHSRRNGSEFVLLRNFHASAPTSPTREEAAPTAPAAVDATAAAAAAAVTEEVVQEVCCSAAGAVSTQQQLEKGGCMPGPTRHTAVVYAAACGGSSGGGWSGCSDSDEQQQRSGPLPLLGVNPLQQQQQQQQQQQLGFEQPLQPPWEQQRRTNLTMAQAWQQLSQQEQQQQQEPDVAVRSSDTAAVNHNSSSNSHSVLVDAASLLAAAADALGDQEMPDSPPKSDASPQRLSAAARAAAAAAAAGSAGHTSSTNSSSDSSSSASKQRSLQHTGSFATAADKFRSLAASAAAAAADSEPDLCSKPLMAFSRRQGSSPPVGIRRSGSSRALNGGSCLQQQQQYALLFPPGSRSFEALSLRKSGGKSPIGAPACHARNGAAFSKKKLPAAPFSLLSPLSSPVPLSPNGSALPDSP